MKDLILEDTRVKLSLLDLSNYEKLLEISKEENLIFYSPSDVRAGISFISLFLDIILSLDPVFSLDPVLSLFLSHVSVSHFSSQLNIFG